MGGYPGLLYQYIMISAHTVCVYYYIEFIRGSLSIIIHTNAVLYR